MPDLPEIALRLFAAALLGGLVGIDRELRERSAGLRTHALVATGAALFMLISAYGFLGMGGHEEPGRLAAQVVSGIGFLGAGTIIFRKDAVRGLTTAASVWTVAGLGLACGLGQFKLAAAATVVTLLILAGLRPLEALLGTKHRAVLRIKIAPAEVQLPAVLQILTDAGARIERLGVHHADNETHQRLEIALAAGNEPIRGGVVEALRKTVGVVDVVCNLELARGPEAPEHEDELKPPSPNSTD